jgi:hypothetical protein
MLRKAYGPLTLSGRYEVLSNGYFFFFLADFFAFFAFFAFLAMLPSVTPKLAQCRPTFDMHSFRLHHNCKIDTLCFEEGERPSHRCDLRYPRDAWTRRASQDQDGKKFSRGRKRKPPTAQPNRPLDL